MELLYVNGQMGLLIQENGKIAEKKVRELFNFLMELYIKDNFKMISLTEQVKKYFQMVVFMKGNF